MREKRERETSLGLLVIKKISNIGVTERREKEMEIQAESVTYIKICDTLKKIKKEKSERKKKCQWTDQLCWLCFRHGFGQNL